jgi:hypothetical protein
MAFSSSPIVPITPETIRDSSAFFWKVKLRRFGQTVEIMAFSNLAPAHKFEELQADLFLSYSQLLAKQIDFVYYSVPFRLTGWSWYEWLYWFLIGLFQKKINGIGIQRRIQHVPMSLYPKGSITRIDGVAHIRKSRPDVFRRYTRIAFEQLLPYLKDPKGSLEMDRLGFLLGQSCTPDEEIRRLDLEAHTNPLVRILWQRSHAHVHMYAPTETAYSLLKFLKAQGFRIVK